MDARERIEDLMFITTELTQLLERENAALNDQNLDVINEHLDRKIALSRAYEIRFFGLDKSEDDLSEVDPILIEELKAQSSRLDQLVNINEQALSIGVSTGQRFMDVLSEAVQSAAPDAGTYGATGEAGGSVRKKTKQGSSVAFDKVL